MDRRGWLAIPLLLFSATSGFANPIRTQTVSYRSDDETVMGFLARPEQKGRHPALIVIHEFWGLNDWVKEQTEKFAQMGFVSLAVDLYQGESATDPERAHELSRGVPQDQADRDLRAAFHYLAARNDVDKNKIGSVGWDIGGTLSLQLAIEEPKLRACIVNYGAMPTDIANIEAIHAAVLGNFGADDPGIRPQDVHAFEKAMKAENKIVDMKVYRGAGHDFENRTNRGEYRAGAAANAWARTLEFLTETLKR